MNKYQAVKTLKLTKARVRKTCDTCGEAIEKGAEYWRESLRLLAKPPGLRLGSYCIACGKSEAGVVT